MEELRRLKEIADCDQQKALTQHKRLVDQHMGNVCSIRRHADTAEKTAVAVRVHLQAVFALCFSHALQVGERPEHWMEWVRGELRAGKSKCAQFISKRFEEPTEDLVYFSMEKAEPLNVGLKDTFSSGRLCRSHYVFSHLIYGRVWHSFHSFYQLRR